MDNPPGAVVLLRDADDQPGRLRGLQQARDRTRAWPFPVVIGLAIAKIEAWVLSGFIPQDQSEKDMLQRLRSQLGFNPTVQSHKLTAKARGAKRDAKQALAQLAASPTRIDACICETPLAELRERGRDNGLADYLSEVDERLIPLFRSK